MSSCECDRPHRTATWATTNLSTDFACGSRESIERIDMLMARQGRILEIVAIDELIARRDHLRSYRDKARFALADSYDRATQAQVRSETP